MSVWTLLAIFALLAFASGAKVKVEIGEEIQEVIDHLHHTCVQKTGVVEQDIKNCDNGIFKDDQHLKCYMYCLLEESSVADDAGVVDYEMLVAMTPMEIVDRVTVMIEACKHLDTMDKDKCQRAFDMHRCTYEKDPDAYHLI